MVSRASDLVFSIPLKRLALFLWLIMLARTGVWAMGSFPEQFTVAFDPFVNHFQVPDQHYIFWNYLGPFIAHLSFGFLSVGSPETFYAAFFIYCLLFAALGSALFCKLVMARLDDHSARAALLLYFLMPISGTAYFWVGMDGLTHLLLLLPFLYPRNAAFGLIIGALLGLQHFEQGLVGYGALFASLLLAKGRGGLDLTPRWAAFIIGGIIIGKLMLIGWFSMIGITLNSDRVTWFSAHAEKVIGYALLHPHLIYASIFGCGWLAVLHFWQNKETRLAFFLPLAGLLLMPFLAEDETRVLALITFPLITAWMFLNPAFLKTLDRGFLGLLGVLFILVPWLWVWRGEPRISAFPYDIAFMLNKIIGWPELPKDLFRWLFWYQ